MSEEQATPEPTALNAKWRPYTGWACTLAIIYEVLLVPVIQSVLVVLAADGVHSNPAVPTILTPQTLHVSTKYTTATSQRVPQPPELLSQLRFQTLHHQPTVASLLGHTQQ
jgi:hypothetical protein